MNQKLVQLLRLPPVLLALLLQFAPITKIVHQSPLLAASPVAIVIKWISGAVALAGACHAVSAASVYITGLTRYTNNASGVPLAVSGSLTTNALGTNGFPFIYRITVVNPGSDHQYDYYRVDNLPAGLNIDTNVGAKGFITNAFPGSTVVAGAYNVRLWAGNTLAPGQDIFFDMKITYSGSSGSPPNITGPPTNRTVFAGSATTFAAAHGGTAPFGYQWRKDGANLGGQTSSNLLIAATTTNDTGGYTVVVTNSLGAVTSSPPAVLTVVVPPEEVITQAGGNVQIQFDQYPNATYSVVYSGGLATNGWLTLTNLPAAGSLTRPTVTDPMGLSNRFYRARVTIP